MSTEEPENISEDPTYEELSQGFLGHIEVVQIQFDSTKVSYADLVKYFFTIHDPTTFGV